jgi:hypothetical protein
MPRGFLRPSMAMDRQCNLKRHLSIRVARVGPKRLEVAVLLYFYYTGVNLLAHVPEGARPDRLVRSSFGRQTASKEFNIALHWGYHCCHAQNRSFGLAGNRLDKYGIERYGSVGVFWFGSFSGACDGAGK